MKLEQQVISLEIAKRLKELGVKQESLFYWFRSMTRVVWRIDATMEGQKNTDDISAFTVAELGYLLGKAKNIDLWKAYAKVWNVPDTSTITMLGLISSMFDPNIGGQMLIYLLENKLITL